MTKIVLVSVILFSSSLSTLRSSLSVTMTIIEEETPLIDSSPIKPAPPEPPNPDEPIFSFLYFGFVGNLCFNFIIQVISYFNFVFGSSFGSMCGIMYGLANNLGQILVIIWLKNYSFNSRIIVSCFALGLLLIAIPAITMMEHGFRLYVVFGLVFLMGFFVAILSSAGFGIAGLCSNKVRTWYTVGTSLAGVLGWPLMLLVDFILKNWFNVSPESRAEGKPSDVDTWTTLVVLALAAIFTWIVIPLYWLRIGPSIPSTDSSSSKSIPRRSFWAILGDVFPLAFSGWMIMFVTFMVLPDQIVSWKTKHPDLYPGGDFGYQNINIYVFQVFDVLARFTCLMVDIKMPRWMIIGGSCSRILFIPLFVLSSLRIGYFDNDIFKVCLNAVFAYTYGILLTLGVVEGTSQVPSHEADVAGYIISFMLVNGIFCGSWMAIGVNAIPAKYWVWEEWKKECALLPPHGIVCINEDGSILSGEGTTTIIPYTASPTTI